MTTENSLFNNDNQAPASDQTPGTPAATNDQPSLFHVGDDKKFGTVDELDKAYGHANEHIGKIENENAEMRKQLEELTNKNSAVDKVLAALKGEQEPEDNQEPNAKEEPAVEDVVAKLLEEREATSAKQTNLDKVRNALSAKYGDKTNDVYVARAKELGVNLDELSATSPDAVLALFGTKAPAQQAAPVSGVNTSNLHNNADDAASPEARHARGEISRDEKFRLQWEAVLKN